ncbi:hypothetical protein ACH47X_16675 [Promicromonospora kroppenstedtii]|uniref:Uncharacterized protein n=1 Tax=Promicromonospora kroppenstedtii TaxID=440482 RepID=A0ABW7XLZ3_9MICO
MHRLLREFAWEISLDDDGEAGRADMPVNLPLTVPGGAGGGLA